MSHAVLPGVALSFLFNIPMFVGALVTGMIASLLIGYISNNSKTKPDAPLVLVSLRFSQRVSSLLV